MAFICRTILQALNSDQPTTAPTERWDSVETAMLDEALLILESVQRQAEFFFLINLGSSHHQCCQP